MAHYPRDGQTASILSLVTHSVAEGYSPNVGQVVYSEVPLFKLFFKIHWLVSRTLAVRSDQTMRKERRTKEVSMRKVVASELVSLDGVMESPEEWSFQFHNEEMAQANEAGMVAADAM